MNPVAPAAQRLLALGITASTLRLVRGLREGRDGDELKALMAERRRLLRELETCDPVPEIVGQLEALRAAVAESDRTVELLVA